MANTIEIGTYVKYNDRIAYVRSVALVYDNMNKLSIDESRKFIQYLSDKNDILVNTSDIEPLDEEIINNLHKIKYKHYYSKAGVSYSNAENDNYDFIIENYVK